MDWFCKNNGVFQNNTEERQSQEGIGSPGQLISKDRVIEMKKDLTIHLTDYTKIYHKPKRVNTKVLSKLNKVLS